MKIRFQIEIPYYLSSYYEVDIKEMGYDEEEWAELTDEEREDELVLHYEWRYKLDKEEPVVTEFKEI